MEKRKGLRRAIASAWGGLSALGKLIYYYDKDQSKGGLAYWEDPTAMGVLVGAGSIGIARLIGHPVPVSFQVSLVGVIVAIAQLLSRLRGIKSVSGGKEATAYPKILNGFNLDYYSTNPKEFGTVKEILEGVEELAIQDDPEAISRYILRRAPNSPVTGEMITSAAAKYGVGSPGVALMIAMLQDESMFGTLGRGAYTRNPANIGNFDNGENRYYPTVAAGVDALAEWLYDHRVA